MGRYRLVIAPDAAEVIRALHPDMKRSVRSALDALRDTPSIGEPLRGELAGLWRYRVRRFRIVYATDRPIRLIRVVAVGPRRSVYEGSGRIALPPAARRMSRRVPDPVPAVAFVA